MFLHMFARMFVRDLLCCLQTDWHQTWQGHRGQVHKAPQAIGFHGNFPVVMTTKKGDFYGQIRIAAGYSIAYDVGDVMNDVT